jgi:hypothetical protein
MKQLITICLTLLCIPAFAQKIDAGKVPEPVKNTFKQRFSDAKDPKWEMEKGRYEANFLRGGKKMAALFEPTGEWLETESPIDINMLPPDIVMYMDEHYKGQPIRETSMIKKKTETNFEVAIKGLDVIFDERGKFIKTEKD